MGEERTVGEGRTLGGGLSWGGLWGRRYLRVIWNCEEGEVKFTHMPKVCVDASKQVCLFLTCFLKFTKILDFITIREA